MRDVLAVMWKELRELLADRVAFRGALFQATVCVVLTGVVVPGMGAPVFGDPSAATVLWVIFPAMLAATISADAFAGERERRTLETLLASPLGDHAIFLGKAATAVLFSVSVACASLLAALASATLRRGALPEIPDLRLFPGVLAGALAAACLTAAIAIAVSVRVPVARAAQQMATMIATVLAAVAAELLRQLSVPLDWATLLRAHQVTFCAGLLGLVITMRFFRRDRVFDTR